RSYASPTLSGVSGPLGPVVRNWGSKWWRIDRLQIKPSNPSTIAAVAHLCQVLTMEATSVVHATLLRLTNDRRDIRRTEGVSFNHFAPKVFQFRVQPWRWEPVGSGSGKRSFGTTGSWRRLLAIL